MTNALSLNLILVCVFNMFNASDEHGVSDMYEYSLLPLRLKTAEKSNSCIALTLGLFSVLSVQYLWNLTILACSIWIKLSKTRLIFS